MQENNGTNEMNFAEAIEQTLKPLNTGDIVKGIIIGVTPTEVLVDLGTKSDGVIPVGELTDNPELNVNDLVKVGQEIDVFVVRVNDGEGVITLSKKKIDSIQGWKNVSNALETKEILTGYVTEIVNGGVVVNSSGVRVFIPASQASERYIADLGILLNTKVSFRVIDFDERRRKVVGSIKSVAGEERARKLEEFWASAAIDKKYTGAVKSLTPFGAFVDLGGVDGLVHISELSWSRIKHPSEVVKVGDTLEVFIKQLDKEKNKVSLGFKTVETSPWNIASQKINVGDVIKVKVVRIVPFGAFAEIMPHVDGLIHISQISHQRISKPSDVLSIGQEVEVKVMEINPESQQIALSVKELIDPATSVVDAPKSDDIPTEYKEDVSVTIGDAIENAKEDTTAENIFEAQSAREPQEGETAE